MWKEVIVYIEHIYSSHSDETTCGLNGDLLDQIKKHL